jgi:type IV secretory pathway ATPase VirB11/archaellum biosynthesis ATPase
MTKLIIAFCSFSKAPISGPRPHTFASFPRWNFRTSLADEPISSKTEG